MGSSRRRTKARQITAHVKQGLEFLESAAQSEPLTKPLGLHYATENLAKAACLFISETLDPSDFAHHGLTSDGRKRNSIANLAALVTGGTRTVWRHVFECLNADFLRMSFRQDGASFLRDWRAPYATAPLKKDAVLRFGELVHHLPELAIDLPTAGWKHPYVVHCQGGSGGLARNVITIDSQNLGNNQVVLVLNHGHNAAVRAMVIDRESDLLKKFSRDSDEMDVLTYGWKGFDPVEIQIPGGRMDVFGELWLDFARGTRVFGELVLYQAALFILSDAVRYQADHWLRLLDDHPAETILIDRLLDIAVRKLPNLVLNELEGTLYVFRFSR